MAIWHLSQKIFIMIKMMKSIYRLLFICLLLVFYYGCMHRQSIPHKTETKEQEVYIQYPDKIQRSIDKSIVKDTGLIKVKQ